MTEPMPTYAQLPIAPDAPPGSSWGVWDDDGALGCLNLLTPERVPPGPVDPGSRACPQSEPRARVARHRRCSAAPRSSTW